MKKSIIYGVLVGVLSGALVVFIFGGYGRDTVDSPRQMSETYVTTDTAHPLQEEIESSVTTSTPEDVPGMTYTGTNLYYADESSDGYVFGVSTPVYHLGLRFGLVSEALLLRQC